MGTSLSVSQYFDDIASIMSMSFKGWEKDHNHHGEQGGIRERRITDFLKRLLPKRYGIGTGHIIDSKGSISNQVDIVIYDAIDGIVLPIDNYYSLFPCESVYAAIEVKSTLNFSQSKNNNFSTIEQCVNGSTKIFNLDRMYLSRKMEPIPCFVFAYQTQWKKEPTWNVRQAFEQLGCNSERHLPEAVFVLEPEFLLTTSGPSGYNEEGTFRNTYLKEQRAIMGFFFTLLNYLQKTKTYPVDLWQSGYVPIPKSGILAIVE